MPDERFPEVYVEEMPKRPNTIAGASTSTAGFVGPCANGPLDAPTLVSSLPARPRSKPAC